MAFGPSSAYNLAVMKNIKSIYRFNEIQAEITAREKVVQNLLNEMKARDPRRVGDFPLPAAGVPRPHDDIDFAVKHTEEEYI
jgi:hypothetical protein